MKRRRYLVGGGGDTYEGLSSAFFTEIKGGFTISAVTQQKKFGQKQNGLRQSV